MENEALAQLEHELKRINDLYEEGGMHAFGLEQQATLERFAQIAAIAFTPRPAPAVSTGHLHEPQISVPEQAKKLLAILQARGGGRWASFSELVADCHTPMEVVGRFLALLELYRSRTVAFDQSEPLGVLQISWTGERHTDETLAEVQDES